MTCLLYLLFSSLLLASVSAKVFVSIDCGSSISSYKDDNSIEWVRDDPYIKTGENHDVEPEVLDTPNISQVMRTLRVFTTQTKNCYSIEVDKDTDRVLVRASFLYGNYDKKSNPPMFDLLVNGNIWATVATLTDREVSHEAVYSVKGMNTISICLAKRLTDDIPFISALEVRSLDTGVYSDINSDYPLYFLGRFAFGANKTIRFPDDEYDRFWVPFSGINSGLTVVKSDAPSLTVDLEDNPPKSVLRTAVTPTNPTNSPIIISSSILLVFDLSSIRVPVHANAYFSEVSRLSSTQKRSFQIFVNSQLLRGNGPVIPPYGSALEVRIRNVTTSRNTTFEFEMNSDSTRPPLLNAMELFFVGDKQTEGTNSKDVNGLAILQKSFVQLQDWSGDPCLPYPYTWDWVACTFDLESPRITALYLSSFGLVGILPDFSDMDALRTIDLHNNSLTQEFPEFFGNFRQLRVLNLADNNFSGTVPSSISENKGLTLTIFGNPHLCFSDGSCDTTGPRRPSSGDPGSSGNSKLKSTNTLLVILGTVIPILIDILWLIVC